MSDPDNFLARWSRRKRQAADEPALPTTERDDAESVAQTPAAEPDSERSSPTQVLASESTEPVFDLTTLPSIESITAETDIRAFLAPGVPTELKLAALRRAWAADPKVRDFVGLADYDWDFHTPGALPGFGPLEMTDDLRREVNRIVGAWQAQEERVTPPSLPAERADQEHEVDSVPRSPGGEITAAPRPAAVANAVSSSGTQDELMGTTNLPQRNKNSTAAQQDQPGLNNSPPTVRSGHGGALPRLPK